MGKNILKSELGDIKGEQIQQSFQRVKKREKSPEKNHAMERGIIFHIKSYCRKYKIDIDKILSMEQLISEIEEKSDDLYEIGVLNQVKKILAHSNSLDSYIKAKLDIQFDKILKGYLSAFDNSAIVQIVDKNGVITYVNDLYREVSGDYRDIVGKKASAMGGKRYQDDAFWKEMWDTIKKGKVWHGIIQNPKMDNKEESYYTSTTITPILNDYGEVIEYVTVKYNVTDLKELQTKLTVSNNRFKQILDTTTEGFWVIDEYLTILEVNKSLCILLGYSEEELIGKNVMDFLDEENRKIIDAQAKEIKTTLHRPYNVEFIKKDGSKIPVMLKASSLFKNGEFTEAIAFISDVSEMKSIQQQLQEMSIKDELTGIWNRRYFDRKLENYYQNIIQGNNVHVINMSVCLFDIDYFKKINNHHGHDVGDIVLKEFGKRLLHLSGEKIEVFRVGGEEFGVIGHSIKPEEFYKIVENFRQYNQEHPIDSPKGPLEFTISGGIFHFKASTPNVKEAKDIYRLADTYLYNAKKSGRNNIKTKDDL